MNKRVAFRCNLHFIAYLFGMGDDTETKEHWLWLRRYSSDLNRSYAKFRFRVSNIRTSIENQWVGHHRKVEPLLWVIAVISGASAIFLTRSLLRPFLQNDKFVEALSGTSLQVGAALLGATAIVASLVLFAMQVNVERLPHGLFRRMSSDRRLLTSFAVSFVASLVVACLPLVTPVERAEWAIFLVIFLTALTLRMFLFAYRRALALINPVEQLRIVIGDVNSALNRWSDQAKWSCAAFQLQKPQTPPNPLIASTVDTRRASFFLQNDWGVRAVQRGLRHCIALHGRAASQADYAVARSALTAISNLNAAYMQAKGRTFFAENGIINMPFATDAVINSSLEELKRNFRVAIGKRDEQHVNMLLTAYGDLAQLYAQIDYGRPESDPWHASLAVGYLRNDLKSIIPHNLPDSMMHGIRILGGSAIVLLNHNKALAIVSIVDELGPIAAAMTIHNDHRPVAVSANEQFAEITLHMIGTGVFDPGYTFEQIAGSVKLVATVALNQPSEGFGSTPGFVLAPYFSPTLSSSLGHSLKRLVNALLKTTADHEQAKKCIANLLEWAKRTRPMAKDVLILAVEKRSRFVFDILHWIRDIVEVLLSARSAPASKDHFGGALENEAERWAQLLSWIPDDTESLDCAANWSATSVMFEIAGAARQWNSELVYQSTQRMLLRWTLRPSRRANARHYVEEAMLALAVVAIKSHDDQDGVVFKAQLTKALEAEQTPIPELLEGVAGGLRRCIEDYDQQALRTRGWDQVLSALAPEQRTLLLNDLAEILEIAATARQA